MKLTIVLLCALVALTAAAPQHHFAVLVAGSNEYWNYRHQADVCHAYQLAVKSGIPQENIIVMAYDDIANNHLNPLPGKIFNKKDGVDVYEGCNIDYSGADVTPEKFLQVLQGKADGRNIKTDENSKIFVFFSDHGAPGLIAFPSEELYADDLHKTIKEMHDAKSYNQMLVYIEACESGSMFDGILEDNLDVFATTAANPTESSWGYYCHPDDTVNGVKIGSCLGDEFAITWMEDTERALDEQVTCDYLINDQVGYVTSTVKGSHVMQYGDVGIKKQAIGNFQGICYKPSAIETLMKPANKRHSHGDRKEYAKVDSRLVKLDFLYNRYMTTQSAEDARKLQEELDKRIEIEERFNIIRARTNARFEEHPKIEKPSCYKQMVQTYKSKCGMDEYDLEFLNHFVNMCNSGVDVEHLSNLVTEHC
ncbi:unnamed protein product [Moneuplotes crassus]|uniref:legumain n=1 Tax=Euplotes crassus TaxID=5936 RepID=A0AAD1XFN0_EUPCR|nr:unnamed protein product [Moneuplotes crassus]